VNVFITVWDQDQDRATFEQFDMVDEFSFDVMDTPGSQSSKRTEMGTRIYNSTMYVLLFSLM